MTEAEHSRRTPSPQRGEGWGEGARAVGNGASAPPRLDPRRGARAVRSAVPGADVPRAKRASRQFRARRGADFDAAVDQDRRLPRGLRLLSAERELRYRRARRKADGARRGARRSARREGRRRQPLLHGRGVARTEGSRSRCGLRHGRRRQGARARDLRHARHAHRRPGAAAERRRASISTITTSTPRRSSTKRSSPRAPTGTAWRRSTACATPASTSAAAASSAWARRARIASA